jgi:threonylcarbamoyladenosine tRNA methylthiotransferase MtaB
MNSKSPTFLIKTLGCKANQYDSQVLREQLLGAGLRHFSHPEGHEEDKKCWEDGEADVCIVNTCTVTAQSDAKSRQCIRALKRRHPNARIVVTGCYAEMNPAEAARIPGVDEVLDNAGKRVLGERVCALLGVEPCGAIPHGEGISFFSEHTRAFVKIQDGCDRKCSYCIVRYARGPNRSREIAEVVQEVERLAANGYREVVLTGIHIGSFGGENGRKPHRLPELIERLDSVGGLLRLRLSSIDPNEVSHELIGALRNSRKMCRHLHIPLQSGSDRVLRRMNRDYTQKEYLGTVALLRKELPGVCITTDAMVGFPGETETDFEETRRVVAEAQFAKVHIFPFSGRPGTPAHRLAEHVPAKVIRERVACLSEEARNSARQVKEAILGRTVEVLVERAWSSNGRGALPLEMRGAAETYEGFSSGYLRTVFTRRKDAVQDLKNRITKVRAVGCNEHFLYGEEV